MSANKDVKTSPGSGGSGGSGGAELPAMPVIQPYSAAAFSVDENKLIDKAHDEMKKHWTNNVQKLLGNAGAADRTFPIDIDWMSVKSDPNVKQGMAYFTSYGGSRFWNAVWGALQAWRTEPDGICKKYVEETKWFKKFIARCDPNAPTTGLWAHSDGVWCCSWPWSKVTGGHPTFGPGEARLAWSPHIVPQLPADDQWSLDHQKLFVKVADEIKYDFSSAVKQSGWTRTNLVIMWDWASARSNEPTPNDLAKAIKAVTTGALRASQSVIGALTNWNRDPVLSNWIQNENFFRKIIFRDDVKAPREGRWEHDKKADNGEWVWCWPWGGLASGDSHPAKFSPVVAQHSWSPFLVPYLDEKDQYNLYDQKSFERCDNEIRVFWTQNNREKTIGRIVPVVCDWAQCRSNGTDTITKAIFHMSTYNTRPWASIINALYAFAINPKLKQYATDAKYISKVVLFDDRAIDSKAEPAGLFTYDVPSGVLTWKWSWLTTMGAPEKFAPATAERVWIPLLEKKDKS